MRIFGLPLVLALLLPPSIANAQCFNRFACEDTAGLTIRSQMSVNVPVAAQASSADALKAMEDGRRDLYKFSIRECDTLKAIYGGECSLAEVSINSSIQDRGMNAKSALVSISNVYALKKPGK